MVPAVDEAVTLVDVEVSVRTRLGGRRAISWQAVVIGDVLIVLLATMIAILTPGSRPRLDAATDVFAITMASAMVVAAYTGVAHLTVFRNRARRPVPVAAAIAFHLSIGAIFLVGFALGATVLGVPAVGGTAAFSVAVLIGGLLVCIPTSLLLDDADRYQEARAWLTRHLAELERLRISEWSLRRALRDLSTRIDEPRVLDELSCRLDVLDVSDRSERSTESWWQISLAHHRREPLSAPPPAASPASGDSGSSDFTDQLSIRIAREHPPVRWSGELSNALTVGPRFPVVTAVLSAFMTLLVLSSVAPRALSLSITATSAVGVFALYFTLARSRRPMPMASRSLWIAATAWGAVSAAIWILLNPETRTIPASGVVGIALACAAAVFLAVFLAGWSAAVVSARDAQIRTLIDVAERRACESAAVFASLAAIVTRMAESPPLSESAAVVACATGLQRVQLETDVVHARRIIDWTESVVAAPGVVAPSNLSGRLDEVVHPWRALADITVDCPTAAVPTVLIDDILAIVDEAVRNACRHGDAQEISIAIVVESGSKVRVEIEDDGVGFQGSEPGVGLERFASLGSGGFGVVPRSPGPGTRVHVNLDANLAQVPSAP